MYKECKHFKFNQKFTAVCEKCGNYLICRKELLSNSKSFKFNSERSAVYNDFGNNQKEVIVYKKPFPYLVDYENIDFEVKKNFFPYDCPEQGRVLIPLYDDVRISDLYNSLEDSSSRARDNYFGYAFANEWKYFFTFTFDPKKVNDRTDDDEIMHYWQVFRRKLQRFDNDVKILCIRERHSKDGALHFHGLIDMKYDLLLKPHYDKNGVWQISKSGAPLFECDVWQYGLHTIAVLPAGIENQIRAINYLIMYTTEANDIGFGKKRFFRTKNLNFKNKAVLSDKEADYILNENPMSVYKETDKYIVYRNFNIKIEKGDK